MSKFSAKHFCFQEVSVLRYCKSRMHHVDQVDPESTNLRSSNLLSKSVWMKYDMILKELR